jgi:hypothetical protein
METIRPETKTLIRKIIKLETEELTPPKCNPFEKSSPNYRRDWEQLSDDAKRSLLEEIGVYRVAWMLRGLINDFEEHEKKRKRTVSEKLIDLWSRNRKTAWQHS